MAGVSLVAYVLLVSFDAFEKFAAWSQRHESSPLDEIVTLVFVLAIAAAVFAYRRWRDVVRESARREEAESEAEALRGLLPICASCKRIKDSAGAWTVLETYLTRHSQAQFTHGICPECSKKLYPDFTP